MKAPRPPKRSSKNNLLFSLGVVLLIVIILVGFGFYFRSVGQAVRIGTEPILQPLDLVQEESLTLTSLPQQENEERVIPLRTTLDSFRSDAIGLYSLKLTRQGTQSYLVQIRDVSQNLVAQDLLTSLGDHFDVHLNANDITPDLSFSYENNLLVIRNLHYLTNLRAKVSLKDAAAQEYRSLIRLAPGKNFTGQLNMTSIGKLVLSGEIHYSNGSAQVSGILFNSTFNLPSNSTLADVRFTAPNQSMSAILNLSGELQGKKVNTYYTLAVGDIAYVLQENGFPRQELTLLEGSKAELSLTFAQTTQLQPLAFPCALNAEDSRVSVFFSTFSSARKIYSYANSEVEVANYNSPGDFANFEPFKGYFVEFAAGEIPSVMFDCETQNIRPLTSSVPDPLQETVVLSSGWNLISMPGTVPYSLVELSSRSDFDLYECSQNYMCTKIESTSTLMPGKPYWVKSLTGLTLRYREE